MNMKNIKKLFAALLIAALCLTGCALAEETVNSNGQEINYLIDEEGAFVIQIPAEGGVSGWIADDMEQDDTVVKLAYDDVLEDTHVVRYEPTGDGDVTVGIYHYIGIACDHYMTWDLHVEDGAVKEVTGGSDTVAPDDADLDTFLVGEWTEVDTQFTAMTIEKNPEKGWDVEIAAPLTHGAYIFKTTVQYDCELDSLVYDKGKFWEAPITDSEEEAELGEAKIAGTMGRFALVAEDGETLRLDWYDDQNESGETIVFEPVVASEGE